MRGSSDRTTAWWDEKKGTLTSGRPPRIEVCLRSLAPPIGARTQQERILNRLATFERQGLVESVSVTVWGQAVCPDSHGGRTPTGERVLERAQAFRDWADRASVPIDSPFEERTVSSEVTGERYQKLVLPSLCVGVYRGDELELVLPCAADEEAMCVDDLLHSLEARRSTEQEIGTSA